MDSISGDANYLRLSTNSKSGQFFFFSNDGDYMIKTISHEEVKVLQSILPEYYEHLVQNPASLIVRITGLYRVRMYHLHRTVYFIVMGSCFRGSTPRMMDRQYDIKGSTVGRNCAPGDDVRKDNDLVADGFQLRLGRNREAALRQLRLDVEFLRRHGFVDYSLLIGAHTVETVARHHPERLSVAMRRRRSASGDGDKGGAGRSRNSSEGGKEERGEEKEQQQQQRKKDGSGVGGGKRSTVTFAGLESEVEYSDTEA